jgi:glycosyltransferase involved in cell wall biosynthesis
MADLPRISIVVPNYNGGATLGRTLQSLVDQQYDGLEILVVDGGSTDDSCEVVRRYEPHLAWWVSERDRGQAHAINKGFARATGEIVNWLCSDDELLPGALATVAAHIGTCDVLSGACRVDFGDAARDHVWTPRRDEIALMPACNPIAQQATFYRRTLLDRSPPVDESFHFGLDTELFNYFRSRGARWTCIDTELAVFHMSGENKTATGGDRATRELERIYRRYAPHERVSLMFWQRRLRWPLERAIRRGRPGVKRRFLRQCLRAIDVPLGWAYGRDHVNVLTWKRWA